MIVSIIIPVYKVEKYIVRCIESVICQTYRQLEVILVDDCSPDNSMAVVKETIQNSEKSRDLTFRYLRHDHNRGLSAARNTGIDAASGDYIFFLDSDDELVSDCIELLVAASENGKIQVVCGGLKFCGAVELLGFDTNYVCYDAVYDKLLDIVHAFITGRIPYSAWNKLLRRDMIQKNKLYFKEGLLFEDNLWTFMLVHSVSKLRTITNKTYHYWIRSGSIATSTDYVKRYNHVLVVIQEREKFIQENSLDIRETKNFLIKNKALEIQTILSDHRLSLIEKQQLVRSILKLSDNGKVLGYSIFYYVRWLLHQLKEKMH